MIYSSLKPGPGVRGMVVEGKGMVLLFRSVRLSDAGDYKCIAQNSAGQDTKSATLVVNCKFYNYYISKNI